MDMIKGGNHKLIKRVLECMKLCKLMVITNMEVGPLSPAEILSLKLNLNFLDLENIETIIINVFTELRNYYFYVV